MAGWHHQLNGCESEQTLGDGEGQGSLACCSPGGCIGLDMTQRLNNHNRNFLQNMQLTFLGFLFLGYWLLCNCNFWLPVTNFFVCPFSPVELLGPCFVLPLLSCSEYQKIHEWRKH